MLARNLSTDGRPVEKAAERCSRVPVSVVPAWPMGKAMNSTQLFSLNKYKNSSGR